MALTNLNAVPSRNLAINGNHDFWQRVEAATTTINTTIATGYTADMIQYSHSTTSARAYTVVQSTDVPTFTQSNFQSTFSYLYTQTTGFASPVAADFALPYVGKMEGFDYDRIHNKVVTFNFWIKASVAGTYSFTLQNNGGSRSYVTTFNVVSSATWQSVSITIQLDNAGTWTFGNTFGLQWFIGAIGGSTYTTSVLNAWQSATYVMASTATNWQATTGATMQIAQVSISEGPIGLGVSGFVRAGTSLGNELALCQRYYEKSYDIGQAPGTPGGTDGAHYGVSTSTGSGTVWMQASFAVEKRALPTVTTWNPNTGASGSMDRSGTAISSQANNTGLKAFFITNTATTTAVQGHVSHWTAEIGL